MKAGWSEDIVMEGIRWQDIRMNASDFRRETPIPDQALVRSSDYFDKGAESSCQNQRPFRGMHIDLYQ